MTATQLISLMIFHGIFDWVLQDRQTAKNKSKKLGYLLGHLIILTVGLLVWAKVFSGMVLSSGFCWTISNIGVHGLIDWYIWRLYILIRRKEIFGLVMPETYAYYNDHLWFCFIMLDQLLHGITYVILFEYFK